MVHISRPRFQYNEWEVRLFLVFSMNSILIDLLQSKGNYCKAFCFVSNNLVVKGFITQFAARCFITNNVYLFIEGPVVRLYFDVLRKTSFRDFNEHFNVHGLPSSFE